MQLRMARVLKECAPLPPSGFFEICCKIAKKPVSGRKQCALLPQTDFLLLEDVFADMSFCWDESGLYFNVFFKKKCEDSFYPEYQKGDSVEIFIDTRDFKKANSLTEFCHHFVFLPQKEGTDVIGHEVTRFPSESAHPLADSSLLTGKTVHKSYSYEMEIVIPAKALTGFDPKQFPQLGFTYRINRYKMPPQHFSVSSKFFSFEMRPELWSSIECVKDL